MNPGRILVNSNFFERNSRILEKIGLTKSEVKVYTALIKLGSTSAGAIIKEAGIQRSATYFCLESLIKKGLVGYAIKNDRKYFEANKPESLFDFMGERKKELEKEEKDLKNIIPVLFSPKKLGGEQKAQEAKIYEGWRGMLNAFFDMLEPLKPGDEGCAFSPTANYGGADPKRLRRLIAKVRMRRARKRIRFRMIMCEDLRSTLGRDQESTPYTEVRYLPKQEINPAVVNVYEDTTLVALWTENPVGFLIRSRAVANSFRNYFNLLWKQAE